MVFVEVARKPFKTGFGVIGCVVPTLAAKIWNGPLCFVDVGDDSPLVLIVGGRSLSTFAHLLERSVGVLEMIVEVLDGLEVCEGLGSCERAPEVAWPVVTPTAV